MKIPRPDPDDILIPAGALALAVGFGWWLHPGVGLIVGGALAIAVGFVLGAPTGKRGG